MYNKNSDFTNNELEILELISPELLAAVRENKPFAHKAAHATLTIWKRRQQNVPIHHNITEKYGLLTSSEPNDISFNAIHLPLWPNEVRAVPNGFLRSALFGAIRKGRRRYINGKELAAIDGVSVRYKGERLDQGDLDVWESVLHLAKHQELGREYRTTAYELLRMTGKTDSGKNRKTLQSRIERLVANAVILKQGCYTYIGSMISSAEKDNKTKEWVIKLNERLQPLFTNDQFTQIEWNVRLSLDGQPLAQWLHGFYSSHASPLPIKIYTLYRLSGSEMVELKHFTQTLKKAFDAVARACSADGEPFEWRIEDGLVFVKRTPTKAQQQHLANNKK